jgi:integrase
MARTKLTTKRAIDALPHPQTGQTLWWDTELPGFGVVVGIRNKTFVIQRDVKGRSRRIAVGRYGDISLHAARKKAEQLAGQMRGGIDPVEEQHKATADNMTLREAWGLYEAYLTAMERSHRTRDGYWKSIERYCSDWIDRPLVEITTDAAHTRHVRIGTNHGKHAANATMRALRAIWRRAQRQHRGLGEPPTINVDFYPEKSREAIIRVEDFPKWWAGVQQIENPVRRDLYIWLFFTGCRRGESESLRWEQLDFKARSVHFPKTKTTWFEFPLSDFLVNLLKARRNDIDTRTIFGDDCPWVFPAFSKTGHVTEPQLNAMERRLFPLPWLPEKRKYAAMAWSPHTLRHTWITNSEEKISMPFGHSRLLTNHAVARSGDAHKAYIHPELQDLRKSQQKMSKFLIRHFKPKPQRNSTPRPVENIVPLQQKTIDPNLKREDAAA